MSFLQRTGEWKFAAALGAALAISACAKTPVADNGQLAGLNTGAPAAPGSLQDFAVNVGDRVFFDSDSSDLSQTSQATLAKQARWLQQYARYTVIIEGHADERGTREYNFALGARRAETTKDYLVARGIPASRIRTISYGKERPVVTCNNESCWSQNRRAVTVLTGGQS
jgi:peptidoglycan-associated lipoprotein